MAKKEYKVVHKKSNVVNSGVPKLPSASTLEYGEIAVNYGTGGETLSIRNSSDQIATFPSRTIIEGMLSSESEKYLTTATTIPTTAAEVGAMATSERGNYLVTGTTLDNVADGITRKLSDYLTTATTIPNVDNYFDSVEYDSGTKRINFKHGETVKDYIDATDFIKDGMVDEVKIAAPTGGTNSGVTCLVVTFNTDAGKEDIEIPISSIFNASNYLSTGATLDDVADGTTRKLSDYSTTAHTHTAAEVGAMATSERSNYSTTAHTHDQYSLTSHTHNEYASTAHTHTAAEVGAMATSERGNYLPTGTTLDDIGDGTTRKLSNYSTTAHTHTAAEIGAMATSERSNYSPTGHTHSEYSTTAHTHTAAEVGAMATSERSNYATTAHTHTAAEVGAMATSERGNYLTTATTIPTESSISGSGFTKNGITGINVNGTAATITNGVAEINVQGGGGSTLPSVTAADNGKVLTVVDGAWAVVMPTTVYTGTDTPLSSIGNDGDIYLQTS